MINEYIGGDCDNTSVFLPKVSIIIPVYNGANYLRDAIGSALAQTYPNLEIIVVNDGSTDNGKTEQIARSYGDRIKYYSKSNGGVASALNLGIEKMAGEYFSWLSHDDMYVHDKIANQIKILSKMQDKKTIVTGGYKVVNAQGQYLYEVNPVKQYNINFLEKSVGPLLRGSIHGCALLIHNSHFKRVGVFDEKLPTTQDYDLFFRMLRGQKIKFHEGLYVLSRSHEQQDSKKLINQHIEECNTLWIGMMESLTIEEKCELDGSVLDFYLNTCKFLRAVTSYDKAIAHASSKVFEEIKKIIIQDKYSTSKFKRIYTEVLEAFVGLSISEIMQTPVITAISNVKTKHRVGFLIGDINQLGGLNRVALKVAGELCDIYDVYVFVFEKVNGKGYSFDERIKIVISPYGCSPEEFQNRLISFLKALEIDVFIGSHNCVKEYLHLYDRLSSENIKTIAWNHEFYFVPYMNSDLFDCLPVKNKCLSRANAAVWLNSLSANTYGKFYENAAIIPNPITINRSSNSKILERPKEIIAVGRFDDPRKGLEELLIVFSKILKACPDVKLNILGPYNLNLTTPSAENTTYHELISRLKIPRENICFTGWISDVEAYYNNSRIHLMTSKYEGFGLVILEAALYEIPSVIFEGSGLDDIIDNGKNGFIIPYGNTEHMANCVINLLKDENYLNEISKETLLLQDKYSIRKIISKWNKLINAVLVLEQEELNSLLKSDFMFSVKNEQNYHNQCFTEYEKCIYNMYKAKVIRNDVFPISSKSEDIYIKEMDAIYNSLSWKITKPLRLFKKIIVSNKKYGTMVTIKKIWLKVIHRTRRNI